MLLDIGSRFQVLHMHIHIFRSFTCTYICNPPTKTSAHLTPNMHICLQNNYPLTRHYLRNKTYRKLPSQMHIYFMRHTVPT
jgi:hypothetical protein